jgi:phage-related tail protein
MGKHRDPAERLAEAERLVERYKKSVEKHERNAERYRNTGQYEKAQQACNLYDRAKDLLKKWQKEVRQLSTQVRAREVLTNRAPKGSSPRVLTPKEQERLDRETRKLMQRLEDRRKRMSAAGLDYDHRTAAGRRHVDLANMGKNLRASINHMNTCLRKKSERTDARVLAWSKFDTHCHRVNAGLIANPRYEPGVDTSTIPGVSDSRLDALREDAFLREELGRDMHGLLVEVIYHQRAFRDLQGLSYLDSHEIYVLFKRALDLAAAYWRIGEDNSFGREVNRVLARAEA